MAVFLKDKQTYCIIHIQTALVESSNILTSRLPEETQVVRPLEIFGKPSKAISISHERTNPFFSVLFQKSHSGCPYSTATSLSLRTGTAFSSPFRASEVPESEFSYSLSYLDSQKT